MAERTAQVNLYLAGIAEDGSSSLVHGAIASAANDEGLTVLNPYKVNARDVRERLSNGGLAQAVKDSYELIDEANIFAAYYGLRNFPSGIELGHLLALKVPGVIFHDSKEFPQLTSEQQKVVTPIYLPSPQETEIINEEVSNLIGSFGELEHTRSRLFGTALIKTGDLALNLATGDIFHKGLKTDVYMTDRAVMWRLARSIDDVVLFQNLMQHLHPDTKSPLGQKEREDVIRAVNRLNLKFSSKERLYIVTHRNVGYRLVDYEPEDSKVSTLEYENFQLDAELPRMWISGELFSLSKVEYQFMRTLLEKAIAGESPTKDQLNEAVFSDDVAYASSLKHIVAQIRKKLKRVPQNERDIRFQGGKYSIV